MVYTYDLLYYLPYLSFFLQSIICYLCLTWLNGKLNSDFIDLSHASHKLFYLHSAREKTLPNRFTTTFLQLKPPQRESFIHGLQRNRVRHTHTHTYCIYMCKCRLLHGQRTLAAWPANAFGIYVALVVEKRREFISCMRLPPLTAGPLTMATGPSPAASS